MATIKAIEGRSVHQIQSGQVIVDLNSVVKELVENSLDAGATNIEIRFRNHGLEAIEVQDNGKGIAPEDFDTVALKHHTSKLSSYDDLTTLDTFGFRGEALSSLCALSRFHILTARAEDGPLGKKLNFDVSGKLKSTAPAAAQTGTTVFVEDIFFNLPVRRKELEKNIKREYGKVISLLYAYACISVGVRFSVTNQMSKAKKTAVFSTKSNTTTKENITNVFGAKTLLALIKLDLHLEMAPAARPSTQGARNWSTQANDRSLEVHVQGHISKPVFGEGRQAPDRQMFFVNSRPCQLLQVSKAINEVYKSFNVSQSPFIFANLVMDTNAYDVNVSPDKRTIMLHDQTALLESLKNALTDLFEQTDITVPQSTLPQRKLPGFQPLTMPRRGSAGGSAADISKSRRSSAEESESETESGRPGQGGPVVQPSDMSSNLILDWVGRDAVPRTKASETKLFNGGLCKDKQKLVDMLREKQGPSLPVEENGVPASAEAGQESSVLAPEDEAAMEVDEVPAEKTAYEANSTPELPSYQPHASSTVPAQASELDERPALHLPNTSTTEAFAAASPPDALDAVHDDGPLRNPHDHQLSQRLPVLDEATAHQPLAATQAVDVEQEEPIPAVTPGSQKHPPGPIQNAFDRMRPTRTPMQTAQITIGDVTTTAVIGSNPPYKKRRIHKPDNSQAVANYGASPSLADGLRKSFAAPGSQLEFESTGLPSSAAWPLRGHASPSGDESDHETLSATSTSTSTPMPSSRSPTAYHDVPIPNAAKDLSPASADEDDWDEEYMDEDDKKAMEEEKVAALIRDAEEAAARPTESNLKRAASILKNGGDRKDCVRKLVKSICITVAQIEEGPSLFSWCHEAQTVESEKAGGVLKDELDDEEAESRLSLTVTKSDFERMVIAGQFNLGFIIAVRPAGGLDKHDELFIIDQHAADEKYNYERLQRTVHLQSQRLVRPKDLDLTATQEEVILNHVEALKANGFEIESTASFPGLGLDEIDEVHETQSRLRLLTLPMSREKTFDLSDLEELIHLLSEQPAGSTEIPRPRKVQKLLAMRACRSSIMVGKTLTLKQMEKVVRNMGEMEKPWNCPHGRPTMRHLGALREWRGWQEGELVQEDERKGCNAQAGRQTDWDAYLEKKKRK